MLTPIEAFKLSIEKWEGLYQDDPADTGNIVLADGRRIGTMRGVTPVAWASFLNKPVREITAEAMKAISLTDAARVYEQSYYKAPGYVKFEWGPSVDVACDIGWGSGPVRGIRALQTLSGCVVDGSVGPKTVAAHKSWLAEIGDKQAVDALAEWRRQWYRKIVEVRPSNGKFLKGWLNRANWQTSGGTWWKAWHREATLINPATPSVESVPSPTLRSAVESIDAAALDALGHEVTKAVINLFPPLAVAQNLLKRLFS